MTPFDNEKYKELQKNEILSRISKFDKLYIEVGGKLLDDKHASRVLPGFDPTVKLQILEELKSDLEVIFCVNAKDIISGKVRGDNSLSYADETFRLASEISKHNIHIAGIMINFYETHASLLQFEETCRKKNIKCYHSYFIDGYPKNIKHILSKDGFGKNDYIKTTKKLVLVSAAGPNSGKLQTALSQIYNDEKNGVSSGYAKYETFPVWNLPLNHLANIAYEMATVDIMDKNMVDPYYKKSHKEIAINYNRDIEAFGIVSKILSEISGKTVYDSPTSMGINTLGFAIYDDFLVQKASLEEIRRRNKKHTEQFTAGMLSEKSLKRSNKLLKKSEKLFKKLENNK